MGGYFLPFIVYSSVMLLAVPFTAKLIPSKPLEDKSEGKYSDKSSDEDVEIGENGKPISTGTENLSGSATSATLPKIRAKINPFKLIWQLLTNKVSILLYPRLVLMKFRTITSVT